MTEPTLSEAALALHIQEGRATDPTVATALVKQFAPGVQRFTLALLNRHSDASETARALTRQIFATALNDPESFAGQENIRAWLYTQTLNQTRAISPSHRAWQSLHPLANDTSTTETPPAANSQLPLNNYQLPITHYQFLSLPEQEYFPLLLRYGHRLTIHEIAQLLRKSENKIHKHLTHARQKLLSHPSSSSHHPRETQRLLDGILAPDAETTFRNHLDTCSECQTHLKQFAELEFHLNTLLYHDPPLPETETQKIVRAVLEGETTPQKRTGKWLSVVTRLPIREISWVVLAVAIFLVLARWLNPIFSSPSPPTTPTLQPSPSLPPAQNLSTVFRQSDTLTIPFPGQHRIWSLTDVRTGTHIPTTPITFSYSGDAATFGDGNQVILWQLNPFREQVEFTGHAATVTALDFSPNEDSLATGDEAGNVLIWDSEGHIRFRLEGHPGPIRGLAYSMDGRYLAAGLNDGIWLWEIQERIIVRIQQIRWEWIRSITFSPDGKWLAAADRDDSIAIWSIPEGRLLLRYETLPNPEEDRLDVITRLAFSPNGKRLASGSFNGLVEVVALSPAQEGTLQGTRIFTFPHPSWVSEVRWSPDGRWLATVSDTGFIQEEDTASRAVYLWDTETGSLAYVPLTARIARGLSRAIFNEQGNGLTASNFDGSLFQWQMEDISHLVVAVPEPFFFSRTENNLLEGLFSEETLPISFTNPLLAAFNFSPFALSPLPAQYTFVNGYYSVKDSVVEMLYQTRAGNTVKTTQRLLTDGEIPTSLGLIGASAVVQPVQIHGTIGEYVVGSWVLTYPDNLDGAGETPLYRWSPVGEARLRWVQEGILMEIQTPIFQLDRKNLTMDDLIRLAENLVAQTEQPILLTYTVQNGDTCIGIAQRYGTSADRIAQVNERDNCDLILSGQQLLVPLPTLREIVAELDLNCDGSPERIRALPGPNHGDLTANFGVVVEAIPPGGDKFWPVWQLTIADVPVDFFGQPEVLASPTCETFLMVNLFGGTGESSGLDIYRWDGEQMGLVLDANGYAREINSPGEEETGEFMVTTQNLIRDPSAGGCTRITTTYEWNGSLFVQRDQTREEGVDCFDG